MPDGILEAHFFLQLEKLEHVAAHAAAEAVEKSFFPVHLERWRLFGMERAESFVVGAGLPQGHVFLDHLDDIRMHAEVFDESLWKHSVGPAKAGHHGPNP